MSLDEFKARLPLVEIVARRVRLTRRGHEHVGLCPFHREKTPSFTVSEPKGFYHCFGCQQHGNAIDFVMATEGLEFAEAVARLAELSGLPLPWRAATRAPAPDQTLFAANEAAARWFAGRLGTASGAEAAAYLTRRGVDRATIERFGLGYAPAGRTALKDALLAEGYAEAQLVAAGLLVQPEDGAGYDRFRHRVMFPIHDRRGRVIAFGGRALGDAPAKYLNSPETALFHKGEVLYGLALAREAVRARGTVIVAEGYMDVIALAQAGLGHAVAPLGTAITETQLGLLWQLADEPIVCLDGDDAGLRAAARLVERALPAAQARQVAALRPVAGRPRSGQRVAGMGAREPGGTPRRGAWGWRSSCGASRPGASTWRRSSGGPRSIAGCATWQDGLPIAISAGASSRPWSSACAPRSRRPLRGVARPARSSPRRASAASAPRACAAPAGGPRGRGGARSARADRGPSRAAERGRGGPCGRGVRAR